MKANFNSFPSFPFKIQLTSNLSLKGDRTSSDKNSVLLLHGAGTSNRHLFDSLRQFLWEHDISSVAFDFLGHGESEGVLQDSSLEERFLHSCQVIETLNLAQPLTIVGSSMSGYTAIKLLEKYQIENLILFVPAVYHVGAFHMRFNQGFSEIIRQQKSWRYSDAWEILESFKGNLLICFAEKDDVIPKEIIDMLYASARNAKYRTLYLVQDSPHKVQVFLDQNIEAREKIFKLIIQLLTLDRSRRDHCQ